MLAKDQRPMPKNQFVQIVMPLYYQGHAYRAGTRIRVTVAAPNGSQPIWSFSKALPVGKAAVAIAFSKTMPSSLYLPVVPGVSVPTSQPPCPGLRNQPCRTYVPLVNKTLAR
jgi:predicted acyl esterase